MIKTTPLAQSDKAENNGLGQLSKDVRQYAEFTLAYNFDLFQRCEERANIVLGIDGIMLTIFLGLFQNYADSVVLFVTYVLFIVSCILSGLFAIKAFKPQINIEDPPNHIFYIHINSLSRKQYINSFKKLNSKNITNDLLNEVYTLSIMQAIKYRTLNRAIMFLVIAFILLGVNGIIYALL